MHFYYLDEAGCTGEDLQNAEQPIFVAGGILVRDEGWNKTKEEFDKVIREYFDNEVPINFELHTNDLFSANGSGFFKGHTREARNDLLLSLLDLISDRSHHIAYVAIDKNRLKEADPTQIKTKDYLGHKTPYVLAYDYLISKFEWYTKEKLGRSARGMLIIDVKEQYSNEITKITNHRRYIAPKVQKVKWLTEFTYAVDSKKNPMIQLSDMVCFLVKKFMEVEHGYRETYPANVKEVFRDFYSKIHDRLIRKNIFEETGRNSSHYNDYMQEVACFPSRQFRKKVYE